MTQTQENVFDASTDESWQTFHENVEMYLYEMPEGDWLELSCPHTTPGERGEVPYIDIICMANAEIMSIAVSSRYLYPEHPDSPTRDAELHRIGWTTAGPAEPGQLPMDVTTEVSKTDLPALATLADMMVDAFRRIWNVPHPSFLRAWVEGGSGRHSGSLDLTSGGDARPIQPIDVDELRILVTGALSTRTGYPLTAQPNGDILIGSLASPLYVCFGSSLKTLTLHAPILTNIVDANAVLQRQSWLNTLWPHVKFVYAGGQLFAVVEISTATFVPRQLTLMIDCMAGLLVRIDQQFATRLGGQLYASTHQHVPLPVKRARSELPAALNSLQTICDLSGAPADTATVDAICGFEDLAALEALAVGQHKFCAAAAHTLGDKRRLVAAVTWDTQGRAWSNTVTSLRAAMAGRVVPRLFEV